ncbi:hypothetical protein [Pseudomonas entomophila]|uniref:Uncharacterized protein n=2 Tax=Pseudomonas entomophila TaxID=312306 RepID=Q1I8W3_PSEE4|nr:hypothetical protein [Pseudomonas entomophila]WMW03357.1 hypothetical protein RAH46_13480 [Pseudomonas entomophila]CAK15915.1 hypothetical protein PSEEN3149 [Pseudomonas entomophila L48]
MSTIDSSTQLPLKNATIFQDDSDGTAQIQNELSGFAELLKKKYPNDAPSELPRPMVYGAVKGLSKADQGISDELLNEHDEGLLVIVPAYPGMKAGDRLLLLWGEAVVQRAEVTAGNVGKYLSLRVPADKVPKGESWLRFLLNPNTANLRYSPANATLVLMGKPGVLGGEGAGEELAAPVVELPASKIIGSAEAKAKVKVRIPDYRNKNNQDVITLYWGDQTVTYVVKDKNAAIVIEVDENIIKAAGDSTALPVYYFVANEVGSESEWSKDAFVTVKLQAAELLDAPVVLGSDGAVIGEIDLSELHADHVVVRVTGQFKAKDKLVLNWSGTTHAGQWIEHTFGSEELVQDSATYTFNVPRQIVSVLSGGSVRLSYTLTRNGVNTYSKTAFVHIKGAATDLPAPTLNVDNNQDYWISADHEYVHALVPVEAALLKGDTVTVKWVGTASDGSVKIMSSKIYTMDEEHKGKVLAISLQGAEFIKPFDGGWVDVSYEITRGKQKLKSQVASYDVGEPAETLPPPFTTPELLENTLNPGLPAYEYDMQVFVPEQAAQPRPCTITLYWETSEGGYHEVPQKLDAGGVLSHFKIPADKLQPKGDKPVRVWVYYRVEWEGKPSRLSEDFTFLIATADILKNMYPPLTVPSASQGKLDLGAIGPDGLVLEVPRYHGMAEDDLIQIKLNGVTIKKHQVKVVGKQEVTLAAMDYSGLEGQSKVVLTYEVEHYPSGKKGLSQPVTLTLEGKFKVYPVYEGLESHPGGVLMVGKVNEFPSMKVRLGAGSASIVVSDCRPPMRGSHLYVHGNASVSFVLNAVARRVSFDIISISGSSRDVLFYGVDGVCTATVKTPQFAAGQPVYTTKFSFTSPHRPITQFWIPAGGAALYIDNFEFEPA